MSGPVLARMYGPTGGLEKEIMLPYYQAYIEVPLLRPRFEVTPRPIDAPIRPTTVRYECRGKDYDFPDTRHYSVFRYDFDPRSVTS